MNGRAAAAVVFLCGGLPAFAAGGVADVSARAGERQLTFSGGHIVSNANIWSPDGEWIAHDRREKGEVFNATAIERVNASTGETRRIYTAKNGATCGGALWHPREAKVVFMLGPERPTAEWSYGISRRRGLVVDVESGKAEALDAMNYSPPFAAGALRGGSHVHVFNRRGDRVSFTYDDEVLLSANGANGAEPNQRNVGVTSIGRPVVVGKNDARNNDGSLSVLVSKTVGSPRAGTDEISCAQEEGWVGANGYVRADGSRQRDALAFQGRVRGADGSEFWEVFVVDLPEDLSVAGKSPPEGTELARPAPPAGVEQRRVTFTQDRKFPGVQGPRHWLRSSPDGSEIAFLMRDDAGVAQLFTVSPNGGAIRQVTRNQWPVASTFSWSPDGRLLAFVMDNSVCVAEAAGGRTFRLTRRADDETAPHRSACVFSPDGGRIAYLRRVGGSLQIFTVRADGSLLEKQNERRKPCGKN
jgi:hypothetical protein